MSVPSTAADDQPLDARARILSAGARLVSEGGIDALTTRAVAAAAAVQAPALYRLFGDKQGLLHAVAEHQLAAFVAAKAVHPPHADPVQDLRRAWDEYVGFGLAHPAVFLLMIAGHDDALSLSPAQSRGLAVLRGRVERIARAGRLRVAEDRAVQLIHAAGLGAVLTLLASPPAARDVGLSNSALDAVLSAIVTDLPLAAPPAAGGLATALRAHLADVVVLSPGERLLMDELLRRVAQGADPMPG